MSTSRETARTERCEHPNRYLGEPTNYTGWFEWMERKAKAYEQQFCPHCKRWAILRSRRTGRLHPSGTSRTP